MALSNSRMITVYSHRAPSTASPVTAAPLIKFTATRWASGSRDDVDDLCEIGDREGGGRESLIDA